MGISSVTVAFGGFLGSSSSLYSSFSLDLSKRIISFIRRFIMRWSWLSMMRSLSVEFTVMPKCYRVLSEIFGGMMLTFNSSY